MWNYYYSRLYDIYTYLGKPIYENGVDMVAKSFDILIEKIGFDKACNIIEESFKDYGLERKN